MLTFEILYAVLLGLNPEYLVHLDEPWRRFCRNLSQELRRLPPLQALEKTVRDEYSHKEVMALFAHIDKTISIPGLTYRQKEALIALRESKIASLPRLCQILGTDRSNTHKRLNALVKKGFAGKFSRPGGVHYFAISGSLDRSLRAGIHNVFHSLLAETRAAPQTQKN
jgi:hypothetical protein